MSGGVKLGSLRVPLVWRAKDGYVTLGFLFGRQLGLFSQRLMNYLHELGICDAATRDKDWIAYGGLLLSGKEPMKEYERVVGLIAEFVANRTKADLLRAALDRGLLIAPIATMNEVLESSATAVAPLLAGSGASGTRTLLSLPWAVREVQRGPYHLSAASAAGGRT